MTRDSLAPLVLSLVSIGLVAVLWSRCSVKPDSVVRVPPMFPRPALPADDLPTAAKVEMGRRLFYDSRLSRTGHTACATCHRQELAFTDGKAHAIGDTGEVHKRSTMSLANVAYAARLSWANPLAAKLDLQVRVPLFTEDPVEMGLSGREAMIGKLLREEPVYANGMPLAFPGDAAPFDVDHLVRAIAAFERTLISGDSAYDRYAHGDKSALTPEAHAGMDLFFGERLECFHCHGGFDFADSVTQQNAAAAQGGAPYHNTGLYNLGPHGEYPVGGRGVYEVTRDLNDMGAFKAPTLRNIAITAPYMHDGSIATLDAVLDHYAAGGRTIAEGPSAGVGSKNPHKSDFIQGFKLSDDERRSVIAFLTSLTDEAFLHDPRFADPWATH